MDEIHSFISDFLHQRSLVDRDTFALRTAEKLVKLASWNESHIKTAIQSLKTDLYRRHPSWDRSTLSEMLASRLLKRWSKHPMNSSETKESTLVKILFVAANPTPSV